MKKILILILLVIFASCSDGNKKEEVEDNDGKQDTEETQDDSDTSDQSDDQSDTSDQSEMSDETEDLVDNQDEEDTYETIDESSDEVADDQSDESDTSDDDFIPECSGPEDCGTHENECKGYDCTEGKCIEKDLDEKVCDDLNACTDNDKCLAGVCKGSDKDCSSLDTPCGVGLCNSANGNCYFDQAGDGTTCDDGDDCTAADVCKSGVCEGMDYSCFNSGSCLVEDYLCSCTAGFDPDMYCYECLGNYSVSSSCADCADGFGGETCTCSITGYGGNVMDFWIEDGTMNIFSVGENGTIMRYTSDAKWVVQKSNTTRDLNSIFGFSETNVYAGGNNVLLHWDGSSWKRLNDVFSGTDYTLSSLWGSGPTDLWAADNYNQKVYHYDGISWSEKTSDKIFQLVSEVWGTANDNVYVVSYGYGEKKGSVVRWNGSDWETVLETDDQLYDISGTDANNIYVSGLSTVWHYNGTQWSELTGAPANNYTDVHAKGAMLYLSTYSGKLVTWDGASTWNEYASGLDNLFSIKRGWFRVYMGGEDSAIASSASIPTMLVSVAGLESSLINDIAMKADGTVGYAVGSSGKIFRYEDGLWTPEASGTTEILFDVMINGNFVYASGANGTVLKRQNDAWSNVVIDTDFSGMNIKGVYVWNQNGGGMRFLFAGYDPSDSNKGFVVTATFLNNMMSVDGSYDPGTVNKIEGFQDADSVTVIIGSTEGKVSRYHSTDTTLTNDSIASIDATAGTISSIYIFSKFKSYVGKTDSKILECGDSICSQMTVNSSVSKTMVGIYKEKAVDSQGNVFTLDSNEWSVQIPTTDDLASINVADGSEAGIFMSKTNDFINFYSCD